MLIIKVGVEKVFTTTQSVAILPDCTTEAVLVCWSMVVPMKRISCPNNLAIHHVLSPLYLDMKVDTRIEKRLKYLKWRIVEKLIR